MPRERLVDGEKVRIEPGGLAWLRRDGGASILVAGPAALELTAAAVRATEGKLFVDTPPGTTTELETPRGPLHLVNVRSSLTASADGTVTAYVLSGEVRTDAGHRAGPGEELRLTPGGVQRSPVLSWEDWTGGLATTDRAAAPAPFGVGTVGARLPGEQGNPRWPLAIQKLEVRVTIDSDIAVTEVDETFFNPTSSTVEGLYRFRTPPGATLHRFGVDREDQIVWGYVKEQKAAAAQYAAHVYAGSTEDPALLEWDAPGVYRARLYPIAPGGSRRVVTRYAEWLTRTGEGGRRRLYVYPMAAEGAEASLPRIEELQVVIDLARAGAREVRTGMNGERVGEQILVRASDVVPRADLSVELLDEGTQGVAGYRMPHAPDLTLLAPDARGEAERGAKSEADYVLVPLRPMRAVEPAGGLDLAIVVDASAGMDAASMAIARAATGAILAHLGKDDRAAVWAGDTRLRPVAAASDQMAPVDEARRRAVSAGLAKIDRGGATDIGALLAEAAMRLDRSRRCAVVYVGDGKPTVGELTLVSLRERLARLPAPVRIYTFGVGDEANMGVLAGLAHGAFSTRLHDANDAARAALRLLEEAERPVWLGATVSLGAGVERVYPRELGAVPADETTLVVGRVSGAAPTAVRVAAGGGESSLPVRMVSVQDDGDVMRRWAEGRLLQLLDEGAGRAAVVEIGMRYGIITPFTSLYVPTTEEARREGRLRPPRRETKQRSRGLSLGKKSAPGSPMAEADDESEVAEQRADNKEGGTGTRAKGEEGSMGNARSRSPSLRYGVRGPADNAAPVAAAPAALGASDLPSGSLEAVPKAAAEAPPALAVRAGGGGPAVGGQKGAGDKAAEKSKATGGDMGADTTTLPKSGPAPARRPAAVDALGQQNAPAAPPAEPAPSQPSSGSTGEAQQFGMIGQLGGEAANEPAGDAFGAGGLGLSGIGEGGGGRGEGIGLGSIGTVGHGAGTGTGQGFGRGHGRLGGAHALGIDANSRDQRLAKDGSGLRAKAESYWTAPAQVYAKVPQLAPPERGDLGHRPIRCGPAASLPLEDRVALWRERLAKVSGNPHGAVQIYRSALGACEAPAWRDRSRLLSLMVDAMGAVRPRVALWRLLATEAGAGDALYGMILVRIRTAAEMRELHDALGLRTIDRKALAKALEGAKTPAERATKLRALVAQWPDDLGLHLALLDALEDAGDVPGAREVARKLRRKPNADAHVRTAVGELYLRLAASGGTPADGDEALRTFGEIVEFASDDPVARRRLGDLLRAHGRFAEAARQYETLEKLLPDDATVPILRAAAAQGMGKVEEAVRWTEKAAGANAPDASSGSAKTARALAMTFLAWAREGARAAGKKEEVARLLVRTRQLAAVDKPAGNVRISLAWSHPDLHPTLWTDVLGAPMPASDGDAMLGIAQALAPAGRKTAVEVRLEPEQARIAARYRVEAVITVVFDEGTNEERIARVPVRFERDGAPTLRYSVAGGSIVQEGKP
jgi:Ca-activated chloride channel family protein